MPTAQLYEQLIVNPTYNVKRIQARKRAGQPILVSPQVMGLHQEMKLKNLDMRQFDDQFALDAAMWYGAIMTGPYSITLLKLFHILYHAGVIYKAPGGWADWSENNFGNTASLLSHGQRVLIQLPKTGSDGVRIWAWLNESGAIPTRGYATHGISSMLFSKSLIRGHRQRVTEKGGKITGLVQSIKGHIQGRHYAFNVALGGEGNRNPFSASNDDTKPTFIPIRADGLNGHVYVNYMPPSRRGFGGILVGCENAQHGAGTNPHTKAGHGLGGAQKVSACGGKKWSKLKCGPQTVYNGFICDLTDRGPNLDWLLSRPLFNPDLLDQKTATVMPVNQAGDRQLRDALANRRIAMGYDD